MKSGVMCLQFAVGKLADLQMINELLFARLIMYINEVGATICAFECLDYANFFDIRVWRIRQRIH